MNGKIPLGDWAMRLAAAAAASALFASIAVAAGAPDDAARIRAAESGLRPAVQVEGRPVQRWTIEERMKHWGVPGVSIAVIRDGRLAWAKGYGLLQAGGSERVNAETVFSVGSLSKVGAAATTLRLVDEGRLDLDRNVNEYMKRWQVPASGFTIARQVTLRGVLSHSAGLTVHGFDDFQPGAALPDIVQTLDGVPPATHEPVRVVFPPGNRFQYSGGGTTVAQLVIEDVTGIDFPTAARRYLFEPLGMSRSSYVNPLPADLGNIAKAHGPDGRPRALPRGYEAMPETAASGLWTTPSDYARMIIALMESHRGRQGSFLRAASARQMLTEVGRSPFGLGPFLDGEGADRRFSHGGANESYRATMEGHLATGNGVVIFTNGTRGSSLYPEIRRAVAAAEGWSEGLRDAVDVVPMTLSADEIREFVGAYEAVPRTDVVGHRHRGDSVGIRILERSGSLYARIDADEEATPLIPVAAARFVLDSQDGVTSLEFVRDYTGRIAGLVVRNGSSDHAQPFDKIVDSPSVAR